MSHLDQEHLRVIALDTKNRVQKVHTVYIGSLNSAAIRVGEVFKEALKVNACAVIIVHNHPSGDPTPSPEDVLVTRQIYDADQLLDIDTLDHLVSSTPAHYNAQSNVAVAERLLRRSCFQDAILGEVSHDSISY